jgi:hypothetical protein
MVVPAAAVHRSAPDRGCLPAQPVPGEGYRLGRESSTLVGLDMIGEELIRGVQACWPASASSPASGRKAEKREDRHDLWGIRIQNAGDRRAFADEIGFVDPIKARSSSAPSICPVAPRCRQAPGDRPHRVARRDGGLRHPDRVR